MVMRGKNKAALEFKCYPGLDEMLDLAENLVCYDYDQGIVTVTDYAEYLFKIAGIDMGVPAFAFFDFNQKEGLIPRSLLRNKLFQDMEEVIY